MKRDYLIIISGLPRSGTSLVMQILYAGGIPLLFDSERLPDNNNPYGYYEHSKIKALTKNSDLSWLNSYQGYAVKIVSPTLAKLNIQFPARIIFMMRSIQEIIESQQKMITRKTHLTLEQIKSEDLYKIYEKHIQQTLNLLQINPYLKILKIEFSNLFHDTDNTIMKIIHFLDGELDIEKMKSVINPELYRCKGQ
ncbi:MAG TPA: sulfotransferase domain-containing protein [Candidatus Hydrogenedens sp.]|nr:sulfotransferase [Candidatus Hydrogenedens sp.]HOK08063.1 sulfotransferase domain-containing protein [Candidatus Hydrogenedens sp.]HOL19343.1 sulfotransferase domain-containing protein [Candidatus Hydrogenedens sp.]HPP57943.1 sulfotransferase domain-containing protein [Candidatus Hydrogenedens sp.]